MLLCQTCYCLCCCVRYVRATLMAPIHYSSLARRPCNVTPSFPGMWMSVSASSLASFAPLRPWRELQGPLCRHFASPLICVLKSACSQLLGCGWCVVWRENGISNQERARGPSSHEGDQRVRSNLPPTVSNQGRLRAG